MISNKRGSWFRAILLLHMLLLAAQVQAGTNVGLGKRVSGPLSNPKLVTDGSVAGNSAADVKADNPDQAVIVLDLQGPVFIGSISVIWNKRIKSLTRTYRGSMDIFGYSELGEPVLENTPEGLVRETLVFKPTMLRYIQIDLTGNEEIKGLKIHEFEVFREQVTSIAFTGMFTDNISEHAAEICWNTDIGTVAKVKYGIDKTKMEKTVTQINVGTEHRIQLTGLKKGTCYYYQVIVDNITAEPFMSVIDTFRTAGIPLPLFTGFKAVPGRNGINFTWRTNVATRAIIELGDSVALKVTFPLDKKIAASRTVSVENLLPGTQYRYKVTCIDTFKNGITSGLQKLRTVELNVALGKPVEGTFTARPDNYITEVPPIIARITDGSTSYFKGMATSGNIVRADQWVQVDLGKTTELNMITVDWRQNAHSRDFTIYGSTDNDEFFSLGQHLDATVGSYRSSSETGDPVLRTVLSCDGKKARYIKLMVAKGSKFYNKHAGRQNFVQIMELKAYPLIEYRFKPRVREIFE